MARRIRLPGRQLPPVEAPVSPRTRREVVREVESLMRHYALLESGALAPGQIQEMGPEWQISTEERREYQATVMTAMSSPGRGRPMTRVQYLVAGALIYMGDLVRREDMQVYPVEPSSDAPVFGVALTNASLGQLVTVSVHPA